MSKIKEIILSLAIMVVLNLFFNYGVFTFYKSPDYEKFCPVELTQKSYSDQSECEAVGGRWFEGAGEVKYYPNEPRPIAVEPAAGQKGWCDSTAECRESYESVREVYNRNVFVVLVILGLISLGLGFLAISAAPVANGFLGGGLLSVIIGSIRYWSEMNDYLRFIILGVALAALIWLGYKKIATRV